MSTLSGYHAIPKTLNGIINVNANSAQISDITILGDTISGVDTIYFEDGVHTASIGLDNNGDLQINGTGELRVTTDGVNMEGETLNMNAGEIHNVPLIHGRNNQNLVIEAKGTGDLILKTNNIDRVSVDDNGNMAVDTNVLYVDAVNNRVGINHTNPSQAFSLIGNQLIAPNTSTLVGSPFIQIRNTGLGDGSPNSLISGVDGAIFNGVAYLDTTKAGVASDTPLTFRINGTERMRLNPNGRVGIGTNNPSTSLDVVGDMNVSTGSNYFVNNVPLIPTQSGNTGKFLTTNGSLTLWDTVPAGPTGPTGPAGPTGPTGPTGPSASIGGSNQQLQFNDNGVLGGTTSTWNVGTNTLTFPSFVNFSNTGSGSTQFLGSLSSNGIIDQSSISTPQLTAIQKVFVGSPQPTLGTLYYGGGSITQFRGSFTGKTIIPLPQALTGSGFIAISVWNNSSNWASATGVCRGGNGVPQLQMSGTNPTISGVQWSTVGPTAWGIQFDGSATSSTCFYSIWMFGDGQNG